MIWITNYRHEFKDRPRKGPVFLAGIMMTGEAIQKAATDHYLGSPDFNGLPIRDVCDPSAAATRELLRQWIQDDVVDVALGELHDNPYINRLGFRPTDDLLKTLDTADLLHAVIYPKAARLTAEVKPQDYADRPYNRCLALGEPQLSLRHFDLSILEFYRQDPRYRYSCDDIRGSICIADKHAGAEHTLDRDKILLQTFGIGYTGDKFRPNVCVYLRYLADLEPAHQQIWRAREIDGKHRVHPDYYRNSIEGEWGEYVSLYDAVLIELRVINEMCAAIGWQSLFRDHFSDSRPKEFGMLLRPTAKQYREFVKLLDKLLSDNLRHKFFEGKVPLQEEKSRPDGRIEIKPIGTLRLLGNWLQKAYRIPDRQPVEEMLQVFKEVRDGRNPDSHAIQEDEFDYAFIDEQRKLMHRVYGAVRTLRLVLASHPRAQAVELPEVIQTGEQVWPL